MDLLGIGSAVGGVANSVASIINTNRTNKANKQLAEYSFNKDLESWNRQNQYNHPTQQMERYRSAGLNPNLIYGTGTASAGNSATLPKYQAPSIKYDYQAPQIAPTIGSYLDTQVKNANIQSINEDITAKRLQNQITTATLLDIIKKRQQEARGAEFSSDRKYYEANIYNWKSNYASDKEYGESQKALNQASISGTQSKFLEQMLSQQLKNSVMQNSLMGKTLEKYSADIASQNLSSDYKKMSNQWFKQGGIKGLSDIMPMLKLLFAK